MGQETPMTAGISTSSRVLLVDHEPNVLTALRRALRGRGFELRCASSGTEGLVLLRREPVEAIVCGLRMPGMNGAEFLQASVALVPDAVRVLLTGCVDVASAVRQIPGADAFRCMAKPWDNAMLLQCLAEGLEHKATARERDALRLVAEQRGEQLRALQTGLAGPAGQHAPELAQALQRQRHTIERLKTDLASSLHLLSTLIEQRAGLTAGCAQRVARHVRALGPSFGVLGEALHDLSFAALVQDIGKAMLPDELVGRPLDALAPQQHQQVLSHPQAGQALLQELPWLQGVGGILARVNENFDGTGVPGRCRGTGIPMASRILRVAADYEHGLAGALQAQRLSREEALDGLCRHRGTRYDPQVVDGFLRIMEQPLSPAGPGIAGAVEEDCADGGVDDCTGGRADVRAGGRQGGRAGGHAAGAGAA
jgi:response regulator RpfG family c-di-GMP phosphodiesterase